MSNPVISGDGIFSHVFVGAADLQESTAFYDAALGALGIKNLGPFGNGWVLFGREKPAFIIARPGNGEASSSNGVTVGFAVPLPPKWTPSTPPALPQAVPTRASPARVATCRVPMRPTCVIRRATRSARTPSSESPEAEGVLKRPAQASRRPAYWTDRVERCPLMKMARSHVPNAWLRAFALKRVFHQEEMRSL